MIDVKPRNSMHPTKRVPRKVDLSPLRSLVGFNLRMLDLRMMKSFSEQLADSDLTPAAATVLLVLESNPGIPLGKLADALMVRHPNMTKLVKRLVASSLVRRSMATDDKRSISIELTGSGLQQAKKLRALQARHDAFVLAALTSKEQVQLMSFVARILATLDSEERKSG